MSIQIAVRFNSYPRTEPPPAFISSIVEAFRSAEAKIGSEALVKCLTSDAVLALLQPQLETLGFQIEKGKTREQKSTVPYFSVRTGMVG